jgi:glutamyl/glutaminyl-tRNA synthetase
VSLADWLLKERTPKELAKELAAKAHENAALKNQVHALEYELFWKTEAITMTDTKITNTAPVAIDLDKLEALAEHLKNCDFWESGNELLEMVTFARRAAEAAPAADERALFETWMKARPGYPFAGDFANLMWEAWQARAKRVHHIGQVSPAIDQAAAPVCHAPADERIEIAQLLSSAVENMRSAEPNIEARFRLAFKLEQVAKRFYQTSHATGKADAASAGGLTDDECDKIAAQTMDRVAAAKGIEHALHLSTDIQNNHTLRRELIRAGAAAATRSIPATSAADAKDAELPKFSCHQIPVTTYLAPDGVTRWPAYSFEQRQEYARAAIAASRKGGEG